ncbi:DOMON domain-containing protein [Chloroflexota bacterium]
MQTRGGKGLIYGRFLLPVAVCGILVIGSLFAAARPAASTHSPDSGRPALLARQIGPVAEMPIPEPLAQWAPDGIISPGEYAHQTRFGNFELHWTNYYQYFYAAVKVRGGDWVALGLPGPSRDKTDIIYITVSEEPAAVYDMFSGTGDFGAMRRDTELGGVCNINVSGSGKELSYNVIEFRRALSTSDPYDSCFSFPVTGITWAYGSGEANVSEQGQGELKLLFYACPEYIC